MTSSSDKLDSLLKLLNGTKNEEKIAGILLINKYLQEEIEDDVTISDIVWKVIKEVGTSFIMKMIQTSGHESIRNSGLAILILSCKSRRSLLLFKNDTSSIVRLIFASSMSDSVKYQLTTTFKCLVSVLNNDKVRTVVPCILSEYTKSPTSVKPIDVLELLVDVLQMVNDGPELILSTEESSVMQSLFIQVFHGAAQESIRHRALTYCKDILTMRCTSTAVSHTLSPLWTTLNVSVSGSIKSVKVKESDAESQKKLNSTGCTFPILLCSIVRGELHLRAEEILSLAAVTSSDDSVTASVEVQQQRRDCCVATHSVCMSLLDCILELLVGADVSNLESDVENAEMSSSSSAAAAPWSELPYHISLDVKSAIDGTLKELIEFISECGTQLAVNTHRDAIDSLVMSSDLLRSVAARTLMTVCSYVGEDDSLYPLMVKHLPGILSCSVLTTTSINTNDNDSDGNFQQLRSSKDTVWRSIVSVNNDATSSKDNNKDRKEDNTSSHHLSSSDVLQYLLPCLLNILTSLEEVADDLSVTERSEQQAQLDRLYNALDQLMPRTVQLISIFLVNINKLLTHEIANPDIGINSGNTDKSTRRLALARGIHIIIVALDLVTRIFTSKRDDLHILLRSEGEVAFGQILCIQGSQIRNMYIITTKCSSQCKSFMSLLEMEFEQEMHTLMTTEGADGMQTSENDLLNVLSGVEQLQISIQSFSSMVEGCANICTALTV